MNNMPAEELAILIVFLAVAIPVVLYYAAMVLMWTAVIAYHLYYMIRYGRWAE